MEQLEKFRVSKKIISFVLPMGYSFNLDGSMMYCTFATLFIAQAYNIELSFGQQITMLLLLMLTSKGMAGVPRASLVVIAATLATFNIPEAGLLLIIGIDQFLDMGRSATNVIGNTLATAVVAKWEGEPGTRPDRRPRSRRVPPDACHAATPARPPHGADRAVGWSGHVVAVASVLMAARVLGRAQEAANVGALSGTLKKIKDTGTITLGYRESSLPFSYLNRRQQPIGYSIDLCREIVEEVSTELDGMEIKIAFTPVTAANRIQKVTSGEVDLECGSTTANTQRRQGSGVLADLLRRRHQADGAASPRHPLLSRPRRQDRRRDRRHHQRGGAAHALRQAEARHHDRHRPPITRSRWRLSSRQGRRVCHRRRAALRLHRAPIGRRAT